MMTRMIPLSGLLFAIGLLASGSLPAGAVPPAPRLQQPLRLSQAFRPPNRGAPLTTAGGATRGTCFAPDRLLVSLMPKQQLGLTLAERPTFFWYIPATTARRADFLLLGDNDSQIVYEGSLSLPETPGIISFTLPADAPALQVGKSYHWFLTIACNPTGANGNPSVEGWVERVKPDTALAQSLKKATLKDRPALYARAGIWHDALKSLAELRRTAPKAPQTQSSWAELLRSVGLTEITQEPLIDCCKPQPLPATQP